MLVEPPGRGVLSLMLAAIMSSPDFGEVCFLIAFIIFVLATILSLVQTTASTYVMPLIAGGLSFIALGWLAL